MKKLAIITIIVIGVSVIFWFAFAWRNNRPNYFFNNLITNNPIANNMLITSPSFQNNGNIPQKFTCDGGDINPELQIQNISAEAKSLALIVDDPDAPRGIFTHWTVWNINPQTAVIKEESVPGGAVEGNTDFGRADYGGPCPPPGKPHHYHFKLYALDAILNLPAGASKSELESEIEKHLLDKTELIGIYQR